MSTSSIPVITIDGPSGTGKGTISRILAQELGFHFLDSGALYRILGLAARRSGVDLTDESVLASLVGRLDVSFGVDAYNVETTIRLAGDDVTDLIRTEAAGKDASSVAVFPAVRTALLARQRAFRQPPGLVADGRDMGTVIFPDATLKIFLTASVEERARRRAKQLLAKGIDVSIEHLAVELAARDERDSARSVAPMVPAVDAIEVDTTSVSIVDVVAQVRDLWRQRSPVPVAFVERF